MNAHLLTPSKFLKAAEFSGRDYTLTIRSVKIEQLEREDKTVESKGVIHFDKTQKGWVLNVTNVKCLIAMFGNETDRWIGKRVTLYPAPNDMGEEGVAIRVRGSPDLAKTLSFSLKLARKKPRTVTLEVTGKNGAKAPADQATAPAPAPAADEGAMTPEDEQQLAAEAREREAQELAAGV